MSVCALVQRLDRAVHSRNQALINVITNELKSELPKLRPVDLVNAAKIAKSDKLSSSIFSECRKRNYAKFKSQDFTVLAASGVADETFIRAVTGQLTNMRTSDLCFISWKIKNEEFRKSGLQELAKRDWKDLSLTNLTQLLKVVSGCSGHVPETLMRNLAATLTDRLTILDSKAFPFTLYSVCEILSKRTIGMTPEWQTFFINVNSELRNRPEIDPMDFVDSVRALGRIRQLDKDVFEIRFVGEILPKLSKSDLSEVRVKGIQNAASSVGINSFSFR